MLKLTLNRCHPDTMICLLSLALAACGGDGGVRSGADAAAPEAAAVANPAVPVVPEPASMTAAAISGPVVTAANCSASAVSSAVSSVAGGGTVNIPAGDCNWGTTQVNVPAGIYLHGAGKDVTIIRRVGSVANNKYLIAYNCSNGQRAMLSDMTLMGNYDPGIQDNGLGLMQGCVDFKVFNTKFTHFIFSGLYIGSTEVQRGVIYKNDFIDNYRTEVRNLGYGIVVYGGGTWPGLELGSQNAVFVEDNYFSGNRHNLASNNGSRYVFRHNTVIATDPVKDFAMTDAHGKSSSPRGSRSWEIYENTYSANLSSGRERTAIGMRGGDGVAFNNSMTSNIAYPIELQVEGFTCGAYPGPDQIRSAYFWNNSTNGIPNGILNSCSSSLQLGRDYFVTAKPGYVPFTYPHPLRAETIGGTTSWVPCAVENATCSFSGTHQVRYGASNVFAYKTATSSIACNNATFGDPLPGADKACDYASP